MTVKYLVSVLLEQYKPLVPQSDYIKMVEFLENNEWGLSFELLCTVLEQDNIIITKKDYYIFELLGTYFEYDSELWENIKMSL